MVVVPLPGDLAVYWSVPGVPFPPSEDGSRDHVRDISVFPILVRQAHGTCPRYICVGHEKSTIIPIWQRILRPKRSEMYPKSQNLIGLLVAQKQTQWNGTLDSTTQSVWCQTEEKAVPPSVADLIKLWSRVEPQKGSTPVVQDFSLQCPNSGEAFPGFQPLRAPWLAHGGGVTWLFPVGL